jgi:hypothetical protein
MSNIFTKSTVVYLLLADIVNLCINLRNDLNKSFEIVKIVKKVT